MRVLDVKKYASLLLSLPYCCPYPAAAAGIAAAYDDADDDVVF